MTDSSTTSHDTMLGRLVVEQGLATSEEVEEAKVLQREGSGAGSSHSTLGQLLVDNGVITTRQLDRLKPAVEEEKNVKQQIPGYKVIGKLGSGAMATVFKAQQLSLDRTVAIKVLPRKHTNNADFVQRFYAEGKAAAKLNHANIVQAFDVGQAGEFHYFVMEFVEGRSVYDDLKEKGKYAEQDAVRIIIQVARALEHAHAVGLMHRDVKPKNIMLTPDGTAKLADMGLARAVTDREAAEAEAGKAFGTPYYISPEQVRGDTDVDFRADVYALGATLYHMVTGKVPFDGPNPSAVMHKHLKSTATPPDELNPKLTTGIAEVIEVCMAKDRNKRYANTADLLEDLEAVARGEAPLQARQRFDFDALASLEADAATDATQPMPQAEGGLLGQPLFWAAAGGWLVAMLLLIAVIVLALTAG